MRCVSHIHLVTTEYGGSFTMQKRTTLFLVIGIMSLILGIIMIVLHIRPNILPVTMCSIGGAFIALYLFGRGESCIRDEMVVRVDALSGYYSWVATFYCVVALGFIQFFSPRLLKDWTLWIIMMFMSLSFMIIRGYLMRRGKTE
jgi:hypothetical protein